MSWDYTTPIGGEFFFLVLQHSQLLTKMASGVLIGFVHTSLSHMRHLTFVHSLVLSLAPHVHPPPESNFCLRQISQLDFSFSAFIFLTGSILHSSDQRSAFLGQYLCSQLSRICEQAEFHIFHDLFLIWMTGVCNWKVVLCKYVCICETYQNWRLYNWLLGRRSAHFKPSQQLSRLSVHDKGFQL